jgi:Domain of unknown function (DUF397)
MEHTVDLTGAQWRKSSYSGEQGNGDGCIEVAFLPSGEVAIRDSKDLSVEPHVFTPYEWECFVAGVRNGEFDVPDTFDDPEPAR